VIDKPDDLAPGIVAPSSYGAHCPVCDGRVWGENWAKTCVICATCDFVIALTGELTPEQERENAAIRTTWKTLERENAPNPAGQFFESRLERLVFAVLNCPYISPRVGGFRPKEFAANVIDTAMEIDKVLSDFEEVKK